MAGDEDEELLARLGVIAANPSDYERVLLAQVEQQAKESRNEELEKQEGDDADESDPQVRTEKGRIQNVLSTLENEIAAVAAARDAVTRSDSSDEIADGAEKSRKKRQKERTRKGGGESMHIALLDERLESLERKRTKLSGKLKVLEPSISIEEIVKDAGQGGLQQGQGSTSVVKKETGQNTTRKAKSVSFTEDDDFDAALDAASGFVETERERLIRMGVITPFSKVDGFERQVCNRPSDRAAVKETEMENELVKRSISNAAASMSAISKARPSTRLLDTSELPKMEPPTRDFRHLRTPFKRITADEGNEKPAKSRAKPGWKRKRPQVDKKWRTRLEFSSDDDSSSIDDVKDENLSGLEEDAPTRKTRRRMKRLRLASKSTTDKEDHLDTGIEQENLEDELDGDEDLENKDDAVLEGGLKIPGAIYDKLFDYQQTGVKWMWELHCQKAGGIIGDEMGLGKTVQVIAFLAALHYSGLYTPSIVICPVTLLRQWKREVKKWYPIFKAEILHDSAVKVQKRRRAKKKRGSSEEASSSSQSEKEEEEKESDSDEGNKISGKCVDRWSSMINRVVQAESGLLITTYEQLRLNRDKLLDINWGYAVLDEGHRVRNPDAEVTLVCKQLQTVHRLIMTGAPIQNRLTELWSLFDFVFPGKLGVLPVFQAQFALPIQIGGYANATPLQVSTAYKCAVVLRDLILPYLLRRMKADVNANLTKKTEHVLFCSLSKEQRAAYRAFLGSSEVEQIMDGSRNSLFGIDIMRKICNHPDLLEREHGAGHPDYGNPERSGKLKLVMQILQLWKSQGHRVLLFAQTQQMLDILQNLAESQGYEYRRMDGSTAVKQRMALIDEFNGSDRVFLFILTTKVGGLGTNLTGANRVIIFDPDWNPSTDIQARERAWRIGQEKDVTIYRLITRGTIEEKVYHRQIYKHFLTNKILKDPQQRRIFKARDMRDLFTLRDDASGDSKTETATLFEDDVGDLMLIDQQNRTGKDSIISESNAGGNSGVKVKPNHEMQGEQFQAKGKEKLDSEDEGTQEEESRVLRNLFEANGIHSAVDHDAILGVNDKEKILVDHEAGRVAQRAADALRQSRMLRANDDIAIPTWTGRSGEAGAPAGLRRRFGATTNSRLARPSPPVQTGTASNARDHAGSGPGSRFDSSSTARPVAGLGAGSLAGKALTSSDLLDRMRERRVGALGAGLDSAYGRPAATGANRFGRGSASISQVRGGSHSSGAYQQSAQPAVPLNRSDRGPAAVPTGDGQGQGQQSVQPAVPSNRLDTGSAVVPSGGRQGFDRSAPKSPFGKGLITSYFPGQASETPYNAQDQSNKSGRGTATPPPRPGQGSQIPGVQPEVMLADIRVFLKQNGGSVPSATIVEHFKARISSKDISLFRKLLKVAAILQKGDEDVSRWVLKPDRNGTA